MADPRFIVAHRRPPGYAVPAVLEQAGLLERFTPTSAAMFDWASRGCARD